MRHNFGKTSSAHSDVSAPRTTFSDKNAANVPSASTSTSEQISVAKKFRKTHSKVRTGCLTCKIRRKKCDETKPACVRCTSTGRKCDGYTLSPAQTLMVPKPEVESPYAAATTAPLPSNCSHSSTLPYVLPTQSNGFIQHLALEAGLSSIASNIFAPARLFSAERQRPEEVRDLKDNDLVSSIVGKGGHRTLRVANSYETLDSGYATPDHDFDKFAEEELEDFILSYVKPTQPATLVFSETMMPVKPLGVPTPASPAPAIDSHYPISPAASFYRLPIPRSPCSYGGQVFNDIERSCFSYFRALTGPCFSSYFESSIWRAYAVFAALAHPVVLTCAAACGAAHRRFGYGISREALEWCAHADRLHKKALRGLEGLKREAENNPGDAGVCDGDAIMTGELLLGIFQGFQGNYQNIVEHINNGMIHLFSRPMTLLHSESRNWITESQPHVFRQLFQRLHCRAIELFGSSPNILVTPGQGKELPSIPTTFANLEEARDFMFTEVDRIVRVTAKIWKDTEKRTKVQDLHVRRLLSWNVAHANTVLKMDRTPKEKRACSLLKTVRSVAYMFLYLTLFVHELDAETEDDLAQDSGLAYISRKLEEVVEHQEELNIKLETVKILVEDICDDNGIFSIGDDQSCSFDGFDGVISHTKYPSTTTQVVPEKSWKAKHRVKKILIQEDDNQVWEILGVFSVAESISAVEEHAVIDSVRGLIPEPINPKWVDISCLMESRRILLRYCWPDENGIGLTWVQEWWAF